MTNEQYLIVSYFTVAGGGIVAAMATAALLRAPLRNALGRLSRSACAYLGRFLPTWLVLAALLAFVSVSYIDCAHTTYQSVVDDDVHLVATTHRQIGRIFTYLAIGVFTYALALAVFLVVHRWASTASRQGHR